MDAASLISFGYHEKPPGVAVGEVSKGECGVAHKRMSLSNRNDDGGEDRGSAGSERP